MSSGKGKKRQKREDGPAPSRRSERLARRRRAQEESEAAKTREERDPKAEAKVFKKDSLTRDLIVVNVKEEEEGVWDNVAAVIVWWLYR